MFNRFGGVRIKKFAIISVIVCLSLLVACSNNQSFEDFFHKKMEEIKKDYDEDVNYSYSLIHQEQNVVHPDDAIAVFLEHNLQGEQIFLAYFEKIKWYLELETIKRSRMGFSSKMVFNVNGTLYLLWSNK